MSKHNKKAQVAVLDLFIAAVIFGLLITTVMLTWNKYNIKMNEQINYNTMVIRTYHISDLLTQYPGKPSAWEKEEEINPITLGLASQEGVIDQTKLNKFLEMDYNQTKDILNIMIYDYHFKLTNLTGSNLTQNKGLEKNTKTVSITRLVIYNGQEALLQFKLEE